jgi:hypothetical protein
MRLMLVCLRGGGDIFFLAPGRDRIQERLGLE